MKAVLLPGTGRRYKEEYISSFDMLVEKATEAINNDNSKNYYLFGHSMGAILSYEIARRVKNKPNGLIISACASPFDVPSKKIIEMAKLDLDTLVNKINFFEGIPSEFLNHHEIKTMIASKMKKDFMLMATYKYKKDHPLNIPIETILGDDDSHVSEEKILKWKNFTTKYSGNNLVNGSHFYFHENKNHIINVIKNIVLKKKELLAKNDDILII